MKAVVHETSAKAMLILKFSENSTKVNFFLKTLDLLFLYGIILFFFSFKKILEKLINKYE